ncbi:hypothetical protein B0H66DRAFT_481900 [Apodospora peruviana]|uniref:Uncharacterized protein n=1 Tax=Apodospora peruviana TaxID=516989 RepID=A0AAE0HYS6_9PEZI|nr:hypothetical protein B0H66DRAFT_481900 [Apodospora peruviana]
MLTITKPVQYGYRSVHDLPTPPSTSRPSPPLISQDFGQRALPAVPRGTSPSNQPMAAPHRGLPLPAAMTPVQLPPGPGSSQPPPAPSLSQAPPPLPLAHGQFPAAPMWQSVTEESMRSWLLAKAEEEKRRQEEEKTQQEKHRLEQRKMEFEILKTSLQGGIPPPMVPVVFAGMGGGVLSQAAVEWAQQYMYSPSQQSHPPAALMPPGPISPEHQRRDSQAQTYAQYPPSGGIPSTPGSAGGPPSGYMSGYPGSPTRPRGQSMPQPMGARPHGGASNLPSLNTNVPSGLGGPSGSSHPGAAQAPQQPQPQPQQHQQDAQPSPSIYFHHWQPPTSHAGGRSSSDQPATPSVGESPRKRKATGPQPAAPPPSTSQRFRSPPFSQSAGLSNPPPGRRRGGHSRQRSDLGAYRAAGRGRGEGIGPTREMSPMRGSATGESSSSQYPYQQAQAGPVRTGAHSVSSLLSDNPPSPQATHYAVAPGPSDMRPQYGEGERRSPPRSFEEKTRGGAAGSTATREGDND